MLNYEDFLKELKSSIYIRDSKTAKSIYHLIWSEEIRIEMVWLSKHGYTALSAVAKKIEDIANQPNSDLKIEEKMVRSCIGRMVSESLKSLGFYPLKKGRVLSRKGQPPQYFTSGTVYEYTGPANEKILPARIVEIEPNG